MKFLKVLLILALSIIYAIWLSNLPDFLFKDRNNYFLYAQYPIERLAQVISTKSFLFKEPLFLVFNAGMLLLFKNPATTITIIVFIITFSISYFCFYRSTSFIKGIFLLFIVFIQTQSLALQVVTIRQGVGWAILLLTLPIIKKPIHIIYLLAFCGLFHNSFFLLCFFYALYWLIFYKSAIKSAEIRMLFFVGVGLVFFILFYFITSILDLKQTFEETESTSGGGAFVLWFAVLIYLLLFKRKDNVANFYDISIIGLVIYLTGYFLATISGRMIGIFIPFIFFSILYRCKTLDLLFVSFLSFIFFYLYSLGAFENFLVVPLRIFHQYLIEF